MRDIDLLVCAGFLYPMSAGFPILRDGEVAVLGNRIGYAGPRLPAGSWRAKRRLGGPDTAVLPGFVNCHTHTASTVFRGRGKGPLESLHELGVLGPDVTIAHLAFASDADLGAEIGSLEAGRKADLIIVDLDRSHLQPFYGDYAALVFYARAADVVTSIIDGRVVYDAGRLTNIDEVPIRAALRRHVTSWQQSLIGLGALPGQG